MKKKTDILGISAFISSIAKGTEARKKMLNISKWLEKLLERSLPKQNRLTVIYIVRN